MQWVPSQRSYLKCCCCCWIGGETGDLQGPRREGEGEDATGEERVFISPAAAAPLLAAARAAASETCSLTRAEARALVAASAGAAAPEIVRMTSPGIAVASRGGEREAEAEAEAAAASSTAALAATAGSALKVAPVAATTSLSTLPGSGAAGVEAAALQEEEAAEEHDFVGDDASSSASAAGPATSSRTECLAPTPPPSASTSPTQAIRAETAGQGGEFSWRARKEEEEGEGEGDEGERGGEAANEAEKALRNSGGDEGDADDDAREVEGERWCCPAAAGVEGHGDCGEKSPPLADAEGEQEEESCTTRSAVAADASPAAPDSQPAEEDPVTTTG